MRVLEIFKVVYLESVCTRDKCSEPDTTKLRLFDLRKFQITRFRLPHSRSKVCACAVHSHMANFNGRNSVDFENYKFISLLEYSGDNRKVSRKKTTS